MARLVTEEGDGEVGSHGHAAHRSCFPIDPAGDVDSHHFCRAFIDCFDKIGHLALDVARQTRTQQGIDDDSEVRAHSRGRRFDGATPHPGHHRRVAVEIALGAGQPQPHRPAALGQQARHDKPVAAIVAWPAKNQNRLQHKPAAHLIGNRLPRIFHQTERIDAAFDRQPVGHGHLFWG